MILKVTVAVWTLCNSPTSGNGAYVIYDKSIYLLQASLSVIFRTAVQQLTKFQQTVRRAVPLR